MIRTIFLSRLGVLRLVLIGTFGLLAMSFANAQYLKCDRSSISAGSIVDYCVDTKGLSSSQPSDSAKYLKIEVKVDQAEFINWKITDNAGTVVAEEGPLRYAIINYKFTDSSNKSISVVGSFGKNPFDPAGGTVGYHLTLVGWSDTKSALTATATNPDVTLTVNTPVNAFIPVKGSGGQGTLMYSISPTLPAGLSFDSMEATIKGTPTSVQSKTLYTVTVTDPTSATAKASFNLTVQSSGTGNSARPDLDPKVRAIVNAQMNGVEYLASSTMGAVNRRLERLHGDVTGFDNGFALRSPTEAPKQVSSYDVIEEASKRSAGGRAIDALAPERDPRHKGPEKLETPSFAVWTSGSVTIGRDSYEGQTQKTRSTMSNALVGMDTKLAPGLKGGLAIGLSQQSAKIDDVGTKNDTRGVTGTFYASWNVSGPVFVDGLLGYGDLRFKSRRNDEASGSAIVGDRSASAVFGSLTASLEQKDGALSYAPYMRLDSWSGSLKSYSETGPAELALAYQSARLRGSDVALGLRGQYDVAWSPSLTVSPTGRLEYRRAMAGQATQLLSYANDASTTYSIERTTSARHAVNLSLGLMVADKAGVSSYIEYMTSLSSGLQGQGLRGGVEVRF